MRRRRTAPRAHSTTFDNGESKRDAVDRRALSHLSCLSAYSSILIRRTRSRFSVSCPLRSPWRKAIRAYGERGFLGVRRAFRFRFHCLQLGSFDVPIGAFALETRPLVLEKVNDARYCELRLRRRRHVRLESVRCR